MVFDVDHGCAIGGEIHANRVELAAADADIEYAIPATGRIDDATTSKNEVGELASHRFMLFDASFPMQFVEAAAFLIQVV
jgi:hypothetical protein